jgi:hypothetical protein
VIENESCLNFPYYRERPKSFSRSLVLLSSAMHADESDEAARDRQLASELEALKAEREDIISGVAVDSTPELAKVRDILRRKLQIAEDSRQYQLANLRLHLELEKKRAWDEFMTGKARLREQLILSHIERRKRLDAIKLGGKSNGASVKAAATSEADIEVALDGTFISDNSPSTFSFLFLVVVLLAIRCRQ